MLGGDLFFLSLLAGGIAAFALFGLSVVVFVETRPREKFLRDIGETGLALGIGAVAFWAFTGLSFALHQGDRGTYLAAAAAIAVFGAVRLPFSVRSFFARRKLSPPPWGAAP